MAKRTTRPKGLKGNTGGKGRPKKYTKGREKTVREETPKNLSRTDKGKPRIAKRKVRSVGEKEESEERINLIIDFILEGKPYIEIVNHLMKEFDIAKPTADQSIKYAREYFQVDRNLKLEELLHEQISRYEHLYKIFRTLGREDLAIKTMEQKEKLLKIGHQSFVIQKEIQDKKGVDSNLFLDEKRVTKEEKSRLFELLEKAMQESDKYK